MICLGAFLRCSRRSSLGGWLVTGKKKKSWHPLVRKTTEADRGEIVDGKTSIAGVALGHNVGKVLLHGRVLQALVCLFKAEELYDLLEKDLDEDTGRGCRVVLVQADDLHHCPADCVRAEKV